MPTIQRTAPSGKKQRRPSMKWWLAVALLLCFHSALGCVNAIGTDRDGRRFYATSPTGEDLVATLNNPIASRHWIQNAKRIVASARNKPDLTTLTDLGILLIHQGQYAQAIRLFLTIERRYPGHHETAANLGTALELSGHDGPALKWIRIGIRRNADEHYGTEWLHARILEAKIAAAQDPAYFDRRSIAGAAFEQVLVPTIPAGLPAGNDGKPVTPRELDRAFGYQLYERTGFDRPRDAVVANLLRDWATLNLAGGPVENAAVLYELALTYGARPDALMQNRQAYIQRVLAQAGDAEPGESASCALCTASSD